MDRTVSSARHSPAYEEEEGAQSFELEKRNLKTFPELKSFGRKECKFIGEWKVTGPYKHQLLDGKNQIRRVTRQAFKQRDPARAIDLLVNDHEGHGLRGAGYPVASTILTFHDPARYTVIDPRALMALHVLGRIEKPPKPGMYSGAFYSRYFAECRQLAREVRLGLRDVDRALYVLGGSPWVVRAVH